MSPRLVPAWNTSSPSLRTSAGRGNQVRVGSVQTALCAIGATFFELDELPNPLYSQQGLGRTYWKRLDRAINSYKTEDPATSPQLAVPVAITEHLVEKGNNPTSSRKTQAACDLCNIAFYYLLRVGEYTLTSSKKRKRTVQFQLQNITLRKNGQAIPHTAPLHDLLQADEATLKITNQKNGTKGQCIHNECTGTKYSPIKSLARRIAHIMTHGGDKHSLISAFCEKHGNVKQITQSVINSTVKDAASSIGLYKAGYTRNKVSSHSLRAGGAMALHLNKCDRDTIKKQGRWSSDTFLMYIHDQISAFSKGLSKKMATPISFRNIGGPTLIEP